MEYTFTQQILVCVERKILCKQFLGKITLEGISLHLPQIWNYFQTKLNPLLLER